MSSLLARGYRSQVSRPANSSCFQDPVLRPQVQILKRRNQGPNLRTFDRRLCVSLGRVWPDWKSALVVVEPETVIGRHRMAFRVEGGKGGSTVRERLSRRPLHPCFSCCVCGWLIALAAAHPHARRRPFYSAKILETRIPHDALLSKNFPKADPSPLHAPPARRPPPAPLGESRDRTGHESFVVTPHRAKGGENATRTMTHVHAGPVRFTHHHEN